MDSFTLIKIGDIYETIISDIIPRKGDIIRYNCEEYTVDKVLFITVKPKDTGIANLPYEIISCNVYVH